jgi:hypothetical protein
MYEEDARNKLSARQKPRAHNDDDANNENIIIPALQTPRNSRIQKYINLSAQIFPNEVN